MHPKQFSLFAGIFFLIVGLVSLIPDLSSVPVYGLPALQIETSYGAFMGYFMLNIVNKVTLIAFGLGGIWAYSRPATNLPASINYSRTLAIVMAALAILGAISQTDTLFGYWPLYGNNVAASAVFALLGAYFGWALSSKARPERKLPGGDQYARGSAR